jgi:hypothetical protein
LIRGIDDDGFRGDDEGRNGTFAVLAVPKKQIISDIREVDPFTLADHLQISPFRPFFHRRIEKEFDVGIRKNNRSHIASFCDNPSGSGQLSLHRKEVLPNLRKDGYSLRQKAALLGPDLLRDILAINNDPDAARLMLERYLQEPA